MEKEEKEKLLREQRERQRKWSKKVNLWTFIIVSIIVIGGFAGCMSCRSSINEFSKFDAQRMSEEYVTKFLVSPASATFGTGTVYKIDKGYHVSSHVDSQNGFGAMIRLEYSCDVIEVAPNQAMIENFKMK